MWELGAERAEETEVNADATLTAGDADRISDDDVEREWLWDWVLGSQFSKDCPCRDVAESMQNVLRVCVGCCGTDCCRKRLDSPKLFGMRGRAVDMGGIKYTDGE